MACSTLPRLMPMCLSCAPEWFVMDHDLAYERDSFADLKLSLDYVKTLLSLYCPWLHVFGSVE
jgi:hypothetical protein